MDQTTVIIIVALTLAAFGAIFLFSRRSGTSMREELPRAAREVSMSKTDHEEDEVPTG